MTFLKHWPFWALVGFVAGGCSGNQEEHSSVPSDPWTLAERLRTLDTDLGVGSQGDAVRVVQDYLKQYGYFPNSELARKYPKWRPMIGSTPPQWGVYDELTSKAVRHFQIQMGIPETGVVDERTRTTMQLPRCGHPDGLPEDPSEKYALQGSKWNASTLTWKLLNTNDVTLAQAQAAVTAAFASWAHVTSLTFQQTTGTPDIAIQFAAIDGASGILGQTFYPNFGGDMTLDTAETWTVASSTPSDQIDLQTVVVHELGHALGISHSSLFGTVMYPAYVSQFRDLMPDDKVAVSAIYDTWEALPGCAKDIGVGPWATIVYVIGCDVQSGGFSINSWTEGTGWTAMGGGAVRVAASIARPWVVNSVGNIYRRNSGVWEQVPGCATDIAAGGLEDGTQRPEEVWVTGCGTVSGGFSIHKWNGSGWVTATGGIGAVRIAADQFGKPWIVDSSGRVFRRTTDDPLNGSWELLSGSATDIGVADPNYAWSTGSTAVGGGFPIQVWDEQTAISGAPARRDWVQVPGGATQISVEFGARPWIVNSSGQIFRALR